MSPTSAATATMPTSMSSTTARKCVTVTPLDATDENDGEQDEDDDDEEADHQQCCNASAVEM